MLNKRLKTNVSPQESLEEEQLYGEGTVCGEDVSANQNLWRNVATEQMDAVSSSFLISLAVNLDRDRCICR